MRRGENQCKINNVKLAISNEKGEKIKKKVTGCKLQGSRFDICLEFSSIGFGNFGATIRKPLGILVPQLENHGKISCKNEGWDYSVYGGDNYVKI